jgi:hypothetical protein
MAEDKRRVVLRALPALIRVPSDEVNFLRILIQVVYVIALPPPDQLLDLRYRIVNENYHSWEGRQLNVRFHSKINTVLYSFLI